MNVAFDCRGGSWSVCVSELMRPDFDGVFETTPTAWIGNKAAIVGKPALFLRSPTAPQKTFEVMLGSNGLVGRPFKDSLGRTWSIEAQAAVVLKKLKTDCIRLSRGGTVDSAVFVVPDRYCDPEKTLLRAARMADLGVTRLVFAQDAALMSGGLVREGQWVLLVEWTDDGFRLTPARRAGNAFDAVESAVDVELSPSQLIGTLRSVIARKLRRVAPDIIDRATLVLASEELAQSLLDESISTVVVESPIGDAVVTVSYEEWAQAARETVGRVLGLLNKFGPWDSGTFRHVVLHGRWTRFPGMKRALESAGIALGSVRLAFPESAVVRGAAVMSSEGGAIINEDFAGLEDRFVSRVGFCYFFEDHEDECIVLFEPGSPFASRTEHRLNTGGQLKRTLVLCSYEVTPDKRIKVSSVPLSGTESWTLWAELRAGEGLIAGLFGKAGTITFSRSGAHPPSQGGAATFFDQRDWIRSLVIN